MKNPRNQIYEVLDHDKYVYSHSVVRIQGYVMNDVDN